MVASVARDGKADGIVILDVRAISNFTDFYVIFSGTSTNHLRALGRRIQDELAGKGFKPEHVDGHQSPSWLVLDYGTVIVHAMLEETRIYYNLERLWGDAPQVMWA